MSQGADVRMDRPDLEGLPPVEVAEGYQMVTYTEALFDQWMDLLDACFPELAPFDRAAWRERIVEQPQFDPAGVFFIRQGDGLCATAFCWLDDPAEKELGRVHWVGALPEHRGQRLGQSVTLAVLHYMRSRGLRRAMLDTQTFRKPAISLYLKLGFRPTPLSEADQVAWDQTLAELRS